MTAQAIIRCGEPLQQLSEFWPVIAPKSPLLGRAMGILANCVMMHWCHRFARRAKLSLRDRSKHPRQRHPATLHGVVFDIFWHAEPELACTARLRPMGFGAAAFTRYRERRLGASTATALRLSSAADAPLRIRGLVLRTTPQCPLYPHFFTSGQAGSGGPNASSPEMRARIL
jgi:hypothetical protein